MTLLSMNKVSSGYGTISVLHEVSLEVHPGQIVSLIGANGAGKTTLLMTLSGQPRATAGRILFDGEDITSLPTESIIRRGMAYVPEGRRVFPHMTVSENLQMGAVLADSAHYDQDVADMFALFPRLQERRSQRAGTLSGGEQQMLAIARALMARPRLLLLDEPSLGLAPLIVKHIFDTLVAYQKTHAMTMMIVEQNARLALSVADYGYVLRGGRITLSGPGAWLLDNPDVQAEYLGLA